MKDVGERGKMSLGFVAGSSEVYLAKLMSPPPEDAILSQNQLFIFILLGRLILSYSRYSFCSVYLT